MQLSTFDMFSDGQAVSATATSTNVLDFHAHGDDIQRAMTLYVQAVGDPWTGNGTVAISWETSADNSTFASIASWPAKSAPDANGTLLATVMPKGTKRYNRLKYTISGTVTGLKVVAGLNFGADEP